MRLWERLPEESPDRVPSGQTLSQRRQSLFELMLRGRAEFEAALRDQAKQSEMQRRIGSFGGPVEIDQSVHNQGIGIGKTRSPSLELPVKQRMCRGRFLEETVRNAVNRASTTKIMAHPPDGTLAFHAGCAYVLRGRLILRVPGQDVVVAAGA